MPSGRKPTCRVKCVLWDAALRTSVHEEREVVSRARRRIREGCEYSDLGLPAHARLQELKQRDDRDSASRRLASPIRAGGLKHPVASTLHRPTTYAIAWRHRAFERPVTLF